MHARSFAPFLGPLVGLVVGCGRGAGVPVNAPREAASACDVTAATESMRRAHLRGASVPVVVVDVARSTVQIAMVGPEVTVMRWVPFGALEPVVREETAVSPAPNAAPDPALRVLPGFRLPDATTPWLPVRGDGPIAFTGFVPSGVKGRIWEDRQDAALASPIHASFDVHAAARSDSSIRARLEPGARVRVRGPTSQPWLAVLATTEHVRVEGFVEHPRPAPVEAAEPGTFEFSEDVLVGEGTPWLAPGTCLWDAPDGAIVGAVSGPLLARPRPVDGWSAITVTTPWGPVTYFAHAPVVDPAPPAEVDWTLGRELRGS